MSMKNGRLKDHIRNVLSFVVWGIFLTIGLYFGWTISKQIGKESQEDLDEIVRRLKGGEKTGMERLTEITDYMSNVAAAVAEYHEGQNSFPPALHTTEDIKASLGVSIYTDKISSITVTALGPDEVTIIATITGIDSEIDGKTFTLTGSKSNQYDLLWIWGGTVPSVYLPKEKIKGKTLF
jgi:hypothetical protein